MLIASFIIIIIIKGIFVIGGGALTIFGSLEKALLQSKVWEEHCQSGGSLKGYVDFSLSFIYDMSHTSQKNWSY
jgi:hypothetical protein